MDPSGRPVPEPATRVARRNGEATERRRSLGDRALDATFLLLLGLLVYYLGHATWLVDFAPDFAAALRDVATVAMIVWNAAVLGSFTLRKAKVSLRSVSYQLSLAIGIGFVYQYIAVLLLAIAQLLTKGTLAALVGIPLLALVSETTRGLAIARQWQASRPRWHLPSLLTGAFFAAFVVLSLSPPCHVDELAYHLVLPREWLAHGGITTDNGNFMSVFPPAMSAIYAIALGLGSEFAPKPLHLVCFFLMVSALGWHARKALGSGPARLAVLLFVAQWAVQYSVQRANNDFQWGYCGLFAFLVAADALADPASPFRRAWPWLAGLFMGAAIAGKLQAINVVAGMEVLLLVGLFRGEVRLGQMLTLHLVAGLVYAPTLARNLLYSADPHLMMLVPWIGNPTGIEPLQLARFQATDEIRRLMLAESGVATLLFTPILVFFEGRLPSIKYDGYIDPFVLVLPLVLPFAARHTPLLRQILLFGAGFYPAWVVTAAQPRYAMPAMPLLAIAAAASLHWLANLASSPTARLRARRAGRRLVLAFSLISFGGMVLSERWFLGNNLAVFVGLEDQRQTLARTGAEPTRKVAEFLDQREAANGLASSAPENRQVYMVFASQTWYLNRPSWNDPLPVNLILLEQADAQGGDALEWLRGRGFRYVLTDFARVPWLRDDGHPNALLNPYPDGLLRLDGMLAFWHTRIEPRLTPLAEYLPLELWEIPPP